MSGKALVVDQAQATQLGHPASRGDPLALPKQVLAYVPGLFVPGLVNFLALSLYTHNLSVEAYGRYALILAAVVTSKAIGFDWLRLGLLRFFQSASKSGTLSSFMSTLYACFVVVSLVAGVAWPILAHFLPQTPEVRRALWLGLPLLLLWAMFELLLQMNRASLAPWRYGVLSGCRAVLCLGAAMTFILLVDRSERGLIAGLILGTLVTVLIDLPRWFKFVAPRRVEWARAKELLRYGIPLAVSVTLELVISTSSRFILQYMLGPGAVGLYTAGYDLAQQTLALLFAVINLASYPLVIQSLEQAGVEAARQQLGQYATILVVVMLPAATGLACIAKPLSSLLLGQAFHDMAGQLIPWVTLATMFMGLRAFYFDLAFQLALRTDLQLWAMGSAALLNVGLTLWFVPHFGILGAVYATVLAYAMALVISMVLGRRVFSLPLPASKLFWVVLATGAMALALRVAPRADGSVAGLVLSVASGVVVYGAVIWAADVGGARRYVNNLIGRFARALGLGGR